MKYNFQIRSRATQSEAVAQKHAEFLRRIEGLPAPWAVVNKVPAPDPGGNLSAYLKVSKFLGPGLRGDLVYQMRRAFRDEAAHDDWLDISFDPAKLDYAMLVRTVFLNYVVAFNGYYAEILDDEFIYMDHEERSRKRFDARHSVFRLAPVTFIDNQLCQRAFGTRPSGVAQRLREYAETVTVTPTGVFIVLSSRVLTVDQADKMNREARKLLE